MWRARLSNRVLIWAVVLTALLVRASDTHLHLCFDGQEPPTSVHFADASVHHDEHHEGEDHADKDVDPFVAALAKKGGESDLTLIVAHAAPSTFAPLLRDASIVPVRAHRIAASPPFHLRPPLRGPPA